MKFGAKLEMISPLTPRGGKSKTNKDNVVILQADLLKKTYVTKSRYIDRRAKCPDGGA
jgi:hypothetical protein